MNLAAASTSDLVDLNARCRRQFEHLCRAPLGLDLTRGIPSSAQLDVVGELLTLPGPADWRAEDGADCRNYGGLKGIPEARRLLATMLDVAPSSLLVGGNSSLALMHDCIVFALLHGTCDGGAPWSRDRVAFLCPVPGYDRHFAICQSYGIAMIAVALADDGPDMAMVESLVAADASIKGMWCVPKYSNPTGAIYANDTIERLARMPAAAADFRLFWDNAYAVHHLTELEAEIPNILPLCAKYGHANRPLMFGSTSKITFAGSGLALFAASEPNVEWLVNHLRFQTIGPDKINQLRHVRLLRDRGGIRDVMARHRAIIAPKFDAVLTTFARILGGAGIAQWTRPTGGYFISLDVRDGCAARAVALAKQAGVALTPAGATFPLGRDPRDRNIRIAPTFPPLSDVAQAAETVALCVMLAATESLLEERR